MSVGRRGFLGVLAGAPIAGPAAVKQAMGQMAMNSPLTASEPSWGIAGSSGLMQGAQRMMEPDAAIRKAFRLGLISRETVCKIIAESGLGEGGNTYLHNLDPDLQAVKSFSMSTRFRVQRDRARARSLERFLQPPQNMWEFGRELLSKGIVSGDET